MSKKTITRVAFAALAVAFGCTDRPATTAPAEHAAPSLSRPSPSFTQERLARRLALALRNPALRAYVKAQLDASPFREHKLHFQRFLRANGERALREIAQETNETPTDVATGADATIPLEMYFPVPAHRAAWKGDEDLLVATAVADHDAPVAFDPQGNRQLLSPDQPPATPVLALVPVETDFSRMPSRVMCYEDSCGGGGGGGGGYSAPAPGLYMTQSHFTQTFEGWLKGSPEFEVHILGQKGATDSLTDYQCAGEHQPVPYYFDQNSLDWSGDVMLFSKTQLDAYNVAHPSQNVRAFVVEDDDTACQIKSDPNQIAALFQAVDGASKALTSGNDSSSAVLKIWKFAKALQKLLTALASVINTNDELVGNAVQDSVAGEFHPGYNWVVRGENNVTNGWIKLELR